MNSNFSWFHDKLFQWIVTIHSHKYFRSSCIFVHLLYSYTLDFSRILLIMGFVIQGLSYSTLRLLCVYSFMSYNLYTPAIRHKNSSGYLDLKCWTIEVIHQTDSHIYFVYGYFTPTNSNTNTSSFPCINSFFFDYFLMIEIS